MPADSSARVLDIDVAAKFISVECSGELTFWPIVENSDAVTMPLGPGSTPNMLPPCTLACRFEVFSTAIALSTPARKRVSIEESVGCDTLTHGVWYSNTPKLTLAASGGKTVTPPPSQQWPKSVGVPLTMVPIVEPPIDASPLEYPEATSCIRFLKPR